MKKLNFPNLFEQNLFNFLESLKKYEENYLYFPTKLGITQNGSNLSLGFSTYAMKLFYMTGQWNEFSNSIQNSWINKINSYQNNHEFLPENSYIDEILLNYYLKPPLAKKLKNKIKNKFQIFLKLITFHLIKS